MLKPEVEALHQELVLRAQHIEHVEDIEKRESENALANSRPCAYRKP